MTDWLFGRRLTIFGSAPTESFMSMSAPMPEGHRMGYCHESFQAQYDVVLEERRWWGGFVKVEGPLEMEEGSPLEYGGSLSHWYQKKE